MEALKWDFTKSKIERSGRSRQIWRIAMDEEDNVRCSESWTVLVSGECRGADESCYVHIYINMIIIKAVRQRGYGQV